jgi:hypothetical protein
MIKHSSDINIYKFHSTNHCGRPSNKSGDYLNNIVHYFPQFLQSDIRIVPHAGSECSFPHPFWFVVHLGTSVFYLELLTVSLSKQSCVKFEFLPNYCLSFMSSGM